MKGIIIFLIQILNRRTQLVQAQVSIRLNYTTPHNSDIWMLQNIIT